MSRTKRNPPPKKRRIDTWPFIPLFKRVRLEGAKLKEHLYKTLNRKRPDPPKDY